MHPSCLDPEKLLRDCDVTRTRRSGPGGQNRNKVETAVVLVHRPTGLVAEANERRSQEENRKHALFRLRVKLALEARGPARGEPSALWRGRLSGGRIAVNPAHADFPCLLAEALDQLAANEHEPKAAAQVLGATPSQLVKLLKLEPRALALVNEARRARGQRPLH